MKLIAALSTAVLASTFSSIVEAHTYVTNFYVNGVDQGNDVCIRPYFVGQDHWKNFPIKDVRSDDIRCGKNNANTAAAKSCSVPAGGSLTIEWHAGSRANATDEIIHESHHGPCMVYLSPAGKNSWVKIWEDAANTGGVWCTDRLKKKRGKMDGVVVPRGLANGKYDVRAEIIAHHESDANYLENSARGAQFYIACLSITVTNGGSTSLPAGVAFPGAYKATDKGIHYNLYSNWPTFDAPYTAPGPKVWKPSAVAATTAKPAATTTKKAVTTTRKAATTRKPAATKKPTTTRKPTATTTRKPATTPAKKVIVVKKIIKVVVVKKAA
ncbi:hypothetical protein HK097_007167 [Rhizophlyctis rosea]|uniref:AA9 family lytic polysaccharide monooxygenase n=1 Tax=Rhizophlyctis rosea TaxID=64517 RepID=A0AAD5SCA5_9FUNG|nr:hypothetical protein HK097_007167 [Rhizophlyctis rosea]